MIVDADCHISSRKDDELAITADKLIGQMDRNGIDKAVIWLKPPYDKDIEPENRAVFDAVLRYPERFLGFGWVNPRLVAHRVCYGSDTPFFLQHATLAGSRAILRDLLPHDQANVLGGKMMRLLDLEAQPLR